MSIKPFTADFWYRHADDPDQTQRDLCQMSAGPYAEPQGALDEAEKLRAQGYTVQQVLVLRTCPSCQGAGRLGKAPKGTRKAKAASLPYWRLTWTTCKVCNGVGSTESTIVA